MATQKPLVIDNGTTQQIANADTLSVGVAVEPSTGTALRIGDVAGTTITTFPGPVRLDGDVTTVGGTTFTTDATFEGNVTFGNGPSDTVTFAATTTVVSDINFATPVAYKITNLANGTNPNDAVNVSQLSALVTGVSAVTASSPLASSGGATPDISFPTWPANASGVLTNNGAGALSWAAAPSGSLTVGTTAIVSGAVNRVLFEGAGNVLQESANLTWDGSTFTVGGVLSLAEGVAPSATASFGKFYALNTDSRPYFLDDGGQAFNLTLDRFNTLTPAASVAIDTSPALPVFNSLALNQNTTFTTSNLGNGRSASVRVICDGTTRTLTFPGTWTWLGSGPPSSLAANDVGYLSITAYGATDADVVAAWSYENMPAVVTGSGVATRVAFWNGTSSLSSDANLYWDDTNNRLGIGTATPVAALDLASGQLAIPDGSAAAPAIAFRDDLNTGLFSPANDIVGVAVNGTEIVRFQESGGSPVVLVGTSTVYGQFTFDSAQVTAGAVMLGHGAAGTVLQESYRGGQFAGVRSRGTKAAPTAVGSGDGLVNMLGAGWTSTGGINYGGLVTVKAEQSYTATASGGRVEIHTTLNGTDGFTTLGGTATERMRIANDGRVAIGQSGGSIIPAAAGSILTLAGGLTQSAGAVSLTGNAASSFTTSAGNLAITGGATLQLTAAAGNEVVVNDGSADVDFRVEGDTNTHAIFVQGSDSHVGIGTSNVSAHLFNVGAGAAANFSVASGGRIHTYGGAAPTDGQVLIGHTANGRFESATLTAGTGISITNGAGSVTIAASNAGGVQPITTIGVTTTLDGTNYTVLCSATLTVNLPAAASNTGRIYNIKNIGAAATITIDPNASETIDGATTYTLTTQYESVTIQCDGTAWFIL